jgi:hypothetical protein
VLTGKKNPRINFQFEFDYMAQWDANSEEGQNDEQLHKVHYLCLACGIACCFIVVIL